jgi:hypothetical protein
VALEVKPVLNAHRLEHLAGTALQTVGVTAENWVGHLVDDACGDLELAELCCEEQAGYPGVSNSVMGYQT